MKNLRVSKKNPSKILKIIDAPQTHRYSNYDHIPTTLRIKELAISSSKEKDQILTNITTYRDRIPHSPSRSQRVIDMSSLDRAKKIRNKSLNRSEQMIKSQEKGNSKLVTKQSIEIKGRTEYSPYLRKNKAKDNEQILNFNSVNLSERKRKESRQSREILKSTSRKKHNLLRVQGRSQIETERKGDQDLLQGAKTMLNQGEYRKCLLIVKSVLKNKPDNLDALYLSAVSWYHLEDRVKAHYFTQQIVKTNPSYSAECYKIKAVCYFKTFEYAKSLEKLMQCHSLFPDEPESYELEAKIYLKIRRWREAIEAFKKLFQLMGNVDSLGMIAACYEQLSEYTQAVQYLDKVLLLKPNSTKFIAKKLKIFTKLHQYEEIVKAIETIGQLQSLSGRQKDDIYYLSAYAYYKLKKYSNSLILIDEGVRSCQYERFIVKFNQLLLMIKIIERDIYEAYHLIERLEEQPQLRVLKRFVEGVISLMRRNYNEGIVILLSIQQDLGFSLNLDSRCSSLSIKEPESKVSSRQIQDQFLNELKQIYLLFLSYGYFTISEFQITLKLMQLQKGLGIPIYFELGFSYNFEMCLGIIQHLERNFKEAQSHFIKAKAIYDNKLEPSFSLALNYLQLMINSDSEVYKLQMIEQAKGEFESCRKIVGRTVSNTAASVYYFSSLLHGHLEEWKEALRCIDESIDRSQDHYWRYFYIRGMLLACIHNFREAINDLSVAINLSGSSKPECYLLRSKCLQIEGEGNQAFKDLQEYISLKPDDPEVHKYAGQLLFQNGAFEDSLTALSHQAIPVIPSNYDIFLTEAKSYFLLGRFSEAIASITKAHTLRPNPEVFFDIRVFGFLEVLSKKKDSSDARKMLEQIYGNLDEMGRIFKISDFYVLKGACLVFEKKYREAVEAFESAIKERVGEMVGVGDEDQLSLIENKKEIDTFSSQMKYNIILCYLNLGDQETAKLTTQQMNITMDQPYYGDFILFKKYITGEIEVFKKEEVFPSRNKLSNFLQKVEVNRHKCKTELKLCVPFPKVEPPQIFPTFDNGLIERLSVLNVERKPEAPWILRQINSIKFTDKMQVFSRLQLDDSESESTSTYQIISVDHSHIDKHSNRSKRLVSNSQHSLTKGKGGRMI